MENITGIAVIMVMEDVNDGIHSPVNTFSIFENMACLMMKSNMHTYTINHTNNHFVVHVIITFGIYAKSK